MPKVDSDKKATLREQVKALIRERINHDFRVEQEARVFAKIGRHPVPSEAKSSKDECETKLWENFENPG